MIRYLKGTFHPQTDGTAVIETAAGIGFVVTLPANSPLYKNYEGEEVRVFTAMLVREDDVSLYGFDSPEELELFKLLITVSGVGAKAGISIMGILPPSELKRAIAGGDVKALSRASGIGKKTAERIILELKDKVGDPGDMSGEQTSAAGTVSAPFTSERSEAISALVSLGYSQGEAENAVGRIADDSLRAEDYIKQALRQM